MKKYYILFKFPVIYNCTFFIQISRSDSAPDCEINEFIVLLRSIMTFKYTLSCCSSPTYAAAVMQGGMGTIDFFFKCQKRKLRDLRKLLSSVWS